MACLLRLLRNAVKPAIALISLSAALFLIYRAVLPIVAFYIPSLEPVFYDIGVYGPYPTEEYASFHLRPPRPRPLRWDQRCNTGYVLLTPNGPSVDRPGPMILNSQGELVWMSDEYHTTANLKVQQYNGRDYLTFWSGEKAATSGKGKYYMLDSSYQVARTLSAVGAGLFGDLHEFKISDKNTALLTVYNVTTADLSPMGRPRQGWIVDSIFQEVDIESGELLFQWRASDHFDPNQSYMTNPLGGYISNIPFDFYHINSIDQDHDGNYLISSRHFHSITCISPFGEILWILGGRNNEFLDLSGGAATNFKWQHDARWLSAEDGILTLFDNGKGGTLHADASYSRALILQLDIANKTASLLNSYTSEQNILAGSQGAVQVLPESEQVFVGWGSAAAYSEYSHDGHLLCETHLGASWFFSWEKIKSYRTFKVPTWHADPVQPPQAIIDDGELFVSWNGATEVAYWELEAAAPPELTFDLNSEIERQFLSVDIVPKIGFESVFDLSTLESSHTEYRVAALDAYHNVLRYSNIVTYEQDSFGFRLPSLALFAIFVLAGLFTGFRLLFRHFRFTRVHTLRPWTAHSQSSRIFPRWAANWTKSDIGASPPWNWSAWQDRSR